MKNSTKALFTGRLPMASGDRPEWSDPNWTHTKSADFTLSYKVVGTCVVFIKRSIHSLKLSYERSSFHTQVRGIKEALKMTRFHSYPERNPEEGSW